MKSKFLRISLIIITFFFIFLIKPQTTYCAVYGVEVYDEGILRQYLELNDGNEYHVYLRRDITVTQTIHVHGSKILATHHDNSNMCTIINGINDYDKGANNQSINVTEGANLIVDRLIFNGSRKNTISSSNMTIWGKCTIQNNCEFWWGGQGVHVSDGGTLYWNDSYSYRQENANADFPSGIATLNGTIYFNSGVINGVNDSTGKYQGIHSNGGNIYIRGGTITNCSDKGIFNANHATLTISGGSIINNKGYGGIHNSGSTLTITGGNIYNNEHGIFNQDSKITFSGGTIYSNSSYGIFNMDNGKCYISGGIVSNNNKYGILSNNGTIELTSGSIHSNLWTGIRIAGGTFNMSGGEVYNNSGAGVTVNSGAIFTMSNGNIYSNTSNGINSEGSVTVTGGTLKENLKGIQHAGTSCIVTGGNFEENQIIYLAADDKYVLTNSSYPTFTVEPNSYTKGRLLVKTTSNEHATNEISNLTLVPFENWQMRIVNNDIVLWKKATIITKFLDQNNCKIADDVNTEYWIDEEYITEAKQIDEYTLTSNSDNTFGTVTKDTEVIYYYSQNSTLNVKYVDYYTGNIIDNNRITGFVGDNITTISKNIDGYTLIQAPENESYILSTEVQEVTYYYAKNTNVTVKYLNQYTNEELLTEIISGYEGLEYSTEQKNFENYEFKYLNGNTSGEMLRNETEVIYYYSYKSSLTVYHKNKLTDEILDTKTYKGYEGDSVITSSINIENYQLVESPPTENITLTKENQFVIYYYNFISQGVSVKYINRYTNEILKTIMIDGLEGEKYLTEQLEFNGYDFDYVTGATEGSLTSSLIEICYYYKFKSSYTVNYIDKFSNEIIKTNSINGYEGDPYSITPENIENYKLDENNLPQNASGDLTKIETTINYYLIKKSNGVTVHYINKINNEKLLDDIILNGYEGDAYSTGLKEISGYTLVENSQNTSGTMNKDMIEVYFYYLKDCSITVNYINQYDNQTLKTLTLDGLESESYTSEQLEFNNYEFSYVDGNITGIITDNEIVINYYYRYVCKLNIYYIDYSNENILKSIQITGYEGENYSTEALNFEGYVLLSTSGSTSGTFNQAETEVIVNYYYTSTVSFEITTVAKENYNQKLSNVKYSLYQLIDNKYQLVDTYFTDGNGKIMLSDLEYVGNYKLIEESTINGRLLPTGYWNITFSTESNNNSLIEINGIFINISTTGSNIIDIENENLLIPNSKCFTLPLTGSKTTLISHLFSFHLTSLGLFLFIKKLRKKG